MKYYMISCDADKSKSVEVLPSWEYDTDAPTSQTKLNATNLPEIEPVFANIYVTDVSEAINPYGSIGGEGFLLSKKLLDIFTQFSLDSHRIYKLNMYDYETKEKKNLDYSWLQIVSTNYEEWIDYSSSSFYLFESFEEEKISDLDIQDSDDLKKEMKKTLNTRINVLYSNLVFGRKFPKYDLFYMHRFKENLFNDPIVSERLKNAIESEGIDCFQFKEVAIYGG